MKKVFILFLGVFLFSFDILPNEPSPFEKI